jgi:formylglycine-generating enzyme required for sulfatase activity
MTPLVDVEIKPGTHQIEFAAPRHLNEVLELEVDGGNRRQTVLASLTPSWAAVSLSSEPAGADVLVDGELQGTTPATLELTAGERAIELRLSGYNAWRDQIMVVADQAQTLAPIELAQADGRIDLASTPGEASVSVDGEYRGRTPLSLRLRPGRVHSLSVAKPGYQTAVRELSVAADSGRALNIELVAEYGQVGVTSIPPGAEIWVDDRLAGTTPASLDLMAVDHSIEVRQSGYAPEQTNVQPRPGYPQSLQFELTLLDQGTGSGYQASIQTPAGQTLRLIPAGRFAMGSSRQTRGRSSNEVLRQVELSRAFYLSEYEVTNAELRAFDPEHHAGEYAGLSLNDDDMPAVNVSWQAAAEYLNWLSIRDGLQPVYIETVAGMAAYRPLRSGYRLPTEAEWAWAARAAGRDEEIVFPWGDQLRPPADRFANLGDLSAQEILVTTLVTYNDGFPITAPVGSFGRNPVGIFDLGGNVAEWVQDFYGIPVAADTVEVDPLGPESGRFHVIRGPSWRSVSLTELRLAARDYSVDERDDVGFRIARNLSGEQVENVATEN